MWYWIHEYDIVVFNIYIYMIYTRVVFNVYIWYWGIQHAYIYDIYMWYCGNQHVYIWYIHVACVMYIWYCTTNWGYSSVEAGLSVTHTHTYIRNITHIYTWIENDVVDWSNLEYHTYSRKRLVISQRRPLSNTHTHTYVHTCGTWRTCTYTFNNIYAINSLSNMVSPIGACCQWKETSQ